MSLAVVGLFVEPSGDLVLNEHLQVPWCAVLGNAVRSKSFFALIGRGLVRLAF
jgi:hypothetical protein